MSATDPIETAMQNPSKVSGDMGSMETHSLPDMIAADKYLAKKKAAASGNFGVRIQKLTPPGAV